MVDTLAIALFRHGLTEANKRHAYLGWSDSKLCPNEGKKLCPPGSAYEILFSSDLGRCLETAKLVFPFMQPFILPDLREINFGCWEQMTYEELKEDAVYRRWLSDPLTERPPEGEAFSEFTARVDRGFEAAIKTTFQSNAKRAAIITHGGVIRFLLTKWAPEKKGFWDWKIEYGQGYELIWKRDYLREGKRCILLQEVPLMESQNG